MSWVHCWSLVGPEHCFEMRFLFPTPLGCSVSPSPAQIGLSWRHTIAPSPGLQVNVLALSICTREAYQSMKERKVDDGHIININR